MVSELKASRELLTAQKEQLAAQEKELKTAQANGDSLDKSYTTAEREIGFLRESVKHLEEAIVAKEQLVTLLTQQRDEARRAAKKANKRFAISTGISVAMLLLRIL